MYVCMNAPVLHHVIFYFLYLAVHTAHFLYFVAMNATRQNFAIDILIRINAHFFYFFINYYKLYRLLYIFFVFFILFYENKIKNLGRVLQ